MPEQKHTPLPYISHIDYDKSSIVLSDNEDHKRRVIAYSLTQPNAEFIVRACNAHYDLVAALKSAKELVLGLSSKFPDADERFNGEWASYRDEFYAALKKAEGGYS